MFTPSEIFGIAVKLEENGEKYYRAAELKVADPSLKQLLDWLAAEEAQHRSTFMELKTACERKRDAASWVVRMSRQVLEEAMGSHALSLEETDLSTLRSEVEIIVTAIGMEEDSLKFYEIISAFASEPDALAAVEEIRNQELEHKRLLLEKKAGLETGPTTSPRL
jgi:rubrerythrin